MPCSSNAATNRHHAWPYLGCAEHPPDAPGLRQHSVLLPTLLLLSCPLSRLFFRRFGGRLRRRRRLRRRLLLLGAALVLLQGTTILLLLLLLLL